MIKYAGLSCCCFGIFYSLFRFICEFFRKPEICPPDHNNFLTVILDSITVCGKSPLKNYIRFGNDYIRFRPHEVGVRHDIAPHMKYTASARVYYKLFLTFAATYFINIY